MCAAVCLLDLILNLFQKIIFEQPWYFVVVCAALALATALFLYFKQRNNPDVNRVSLYALITLRFISVFLLSCMLLAIFVRRISTQTQQPIILFAIDNSASMREEPDSAKSLSTQLQTLKDELKDKYEVKSLLFGSKVRSGETADFTDKETDLSELVKEVENNYANQAVGALVLVSDGVNNKGANPVYSVDDFPFAIWTLACGDTTEKKDISIQKINHNEVVYAGNQFPVEVQINASQCKGQAAKLNLKQGGKIIQTRNLSITQDRFSETQTFTLQAEKAGLQRYELELVSELKEQNSKNNVRSFVIEVIDNQQKVFLFATAPHPDVAALREAILSFGNYEFKSFLLPEKPQQLKGCNLLIIHGYDKQCQDLLALCKDERVPYLIIHPQTFEGLGTVSLQSSIPRSQDVEPVFREGFSAFTISTELRNFLQTAPAVKCALGRYNTLTGNQLLLSQRIGAVETDSPILFFNEISGLKSGVFVGDGLWKWRLADYEEHGTKNLFNELISKSVQYLSVKSDKSFFRVHCPSIVSESDAVEITAELYNKTYELVNEPEVALELSDATKKKYNYTFSKYNSAYKVDLGKLPPGEYAYKASVIYNGERLIKEGSFAIKELSAEQSGESANHSLLRQMALRSDGKFFTRATLSQLQTELLNNDSIKPITYTQSSIAPLSEIAWLFFTILLLLIVEWILRKQLFGI